MGTPRKNFDVGLAAEMYLSGISASHLADYFNVSSRTMRRRLKDHGVTIYRGKRRSNLEEGTRWCYRCLTVKPVSEFGKKVGGCRECEKIRYDKWANDNPDKIKENTKRYYDENTEKAKAATKKWVEENREYKNEYSRTWRENHPEWKDRMPGGLYTRQEVWDKTDGECWYCVLPMIREWERGNLLCFTVDHVIAIANGGQNTLENSVPAHYSCNSSKNDRLVEELDIDWVESRRAYVNDLMKENVNGG